MKGKMKNVEKYGVKRKKGITILALSVTIIILLILAGVSITTLGGDNGIVVNASKAKFMTEVRDIQEQIELAEIKNNDGEDFQFGTLEKIIERIDGYNEILSVENGNLVYDAEKVSKSQAKWLENMDIYAKQNWIPIYTGEQLQKIASGDYVLIEEVGGISYNFSSDASYSIQNNIDLNGSEEKKWTPISSFEGTLNGNHYTISNVYIYDEQRPSMFRENNGYIYDICINNLKVSNSYSSGCAMITNTNKGTISGIKITGTIDIAVGGNGILTANNYGEIYNCYNYAESTVMPLVYKNNTEAMVNRCGNYADTATSGISLYNYGTISECFNSGTIYRVTQANGICTVNDGIIEKCYNKGTITGSSSTYGGIVYQNNANGIIRYCYNAGDVIGYINKQTGGIVCYNKGKIQNCYNIGEVTTSGISYTNEGTILNSYYLDAKAINYCNSDTGTISSECKALNSMEMQEVYKILNEEEKIFVNDDKNLNFGYPIFYWQIE